MFTVGLYFGIMVIAHVMEKALRSEEKTLIYKKAVSL